MDGSRSLTAMLAASPAFAALGEPIERVRQSLVVWGRHLSRQAGPAYAGAIGDALRYLEAQSVRVAVIGQVKAGKSSFISALIGRPNLLPSDVNPWTTVVTNLHFHHSVPATESAVFTLFDADEWNRIADSGGTLRELTERLVPGFDSELLRTQLRSMRIRAEQRLGTGFAELLGQRHSFPMLTRELLGRYVSAGSDDPGGDQWAGWYSDITKTADLYFGSDRTGFPLTLIDTPGTNDPLLVRDEITRLSLSSAELYVVVLTAQQPLSGGDLALLRLLRGLHKDRIIIFVNRIDGLGDIASGSQRVLRHIEARLREEFPSARFPIVLGSARWASLALGSGPGDISAALDPAFCAYAASQGFPDVEAPGGRRPATAVPTLLSLSGIPQVASAIGRMMTQGSTAHAVRQLASFFHELAKSSEATQRAELRAVERALAETRSSTVAQAGDLHRWRSELDQLASLGRELQGNLGAYEESLRALVDRCVGDLRRLLDIKLEGFIDRRIVELTRAYERNTQQVWSCNSAPLRSELHDEFLRVYLYWDEKIKQADALIRAQLQSVMPGSSLSAGEGGLADMPGGTPQYPSVSALGRVVALDLAMPWWKAWWHGRPSLESRTGELRRLVRGEFDPLIEDLIDAAAAALGERAHFASRQARLGTIDIVNSIQRRSEELLSQLRDAAGPARGEAIERLGRQQADIQASLAHWVEIRSGLSALVQACETIFEGPRGPPVPPA